MIAHSERKGKQIFEGTAENGNSVFFDANPAHANGPSPMETVLMALCSCTSVGVVKVLEKMCEPLVGLRVTATATQAETPPQVFTRIKLTYLVSGQLSHKSVEHAVELVEEKYCPVAKMLEKTAAIEHEIIYQESEPEP